MDFAEFKTSLIEKIKSDKKHGCDKVIESHQKLIDEYFNRKENYSYVKEFVHDLCELVLSGYTSSSILNLLKNPSFAEVAAEFKQSDVLVKACQDKGKKKVAEWLLKNVDMNLEAKDESGRTALMVAAENDFTTMVKTLLTKKEVDVNAVDSNGNSALFYAIGKSSFYTVMEAINVDPALLNNDGKNVAMRLVEEGQQLQLSSLVKKYPTLVDVDFVNKKGESLVTLFIKNYYAHLQDPKAKSFQKYKALGKMEKTLINIGCNFNVPIDEDGNTAMMFFFFVQDYASANFVHNRSILTPEKNIDLSAKNKHGVNATYLSLSINEDIFKKNKRCFLFTLSDFKQSLRKNKTFDTSLTDDSKDITIRENLNTESNYKPSDYVVSVNEWMHDTLFYQEPDQTDADRTSFLYTMIKSIF